MITESNISYIDFDPMHPDANPMLDDLRRNFNDAATSMDIYPPSSPIADPSIPPQPVRHRAPKQRRAPAEPHFPPSEVGIEDYVFTREEVLGPIGALAMAMHAESPQQARAYQQAYKAREISRTSFIVQMAVEIDPRVSTVIETMRTAPQKLGGLAVRAWNRTKEAGVAAAQHIREAAFTDRSRHARMGDEGLSIFATGEYPRVV